MDITMPGMNGMTKGERHELAKIVRMNARVAKDAIGAREAELLADFEKKLAARYPENDPRWVAITEKAKRLVADADQQIAQLCRDSGIPAEFRPHLGYQWYGRGENASRERRAELTRLAKAQIGAMGKSARIDIDRRAASLATNLIAGGLESTAARAFLDSLPSIDELMPRLCLRADTAADADLAQLITVE